MKTPTLPQEAPLQTPEELLDTLADLPDTLSKLATYANYKIREATFNQMQAVDARRAEDFVQGAMLKFLTGARKWNRRKCPSLYQYLKGIVRSDLSDAFRKASRIDPFLNTSEEFPEQTPSDLFREHSHWVEPEMVWQRVEKEVKERSDEVLAECWTGFQLNKRPREISEDAGVPIQQVYNAQRRLTGLFKGVETNFRSMIRGA